MTRTTKTVTKEYDAKGKLVKETIVETTDSYSYSYVQPWSYPRPYPIQPVWVSSSSPSTGSFTTAAPTPGTISRANT